MPRMRGILGVKKDPKQQTLFMVTGGDEWPSSDSEDTDYEPGDKPAQDSSGSESDDSGNDIPATAKKTTARSSKAKNSTNTRSPLKRRRPQSQKKGSKRSKKIALESSSVHTRAGGKKQNASSSSSCSASTSASASSGWAVEGGTFGRLPLELWSKIFRASVQMHGALPFLCRASKVCREWRDLAREPGLWRSLDLSFGWIKSTDLTLQRLAQSRLSQCRDINLTGWKNLTNEAVRVMCESCPHLRVVNLSHCRKLSGVSVTALATHCPQLTSVDLSFTTPDAVSVKSLKCLVGKVGSSLKELWLGGNHLKGFNLVLNEIMLKCGNLDTLDLSNSTFSTEFLSLDVEKLQSSCPNLRVLGLANCVVRANKDSLNCQGAGFSKLEELSCANQFFREHDLLGTRGASDSLLVRLLHKAEKLRLLDLRGCCIFNQRTSIIPGASSVARDLQQLYLSHSSISSHGDCLAPALRQWNHSLRELDLSWITPSAVDFEAAFRALAENPACPLRQINLAGSSATLPCVLTALENFHQLQSLDLSSCRALPRGIKGQHSGATALNKLRASLQGEYASSDTDSD